MVVDRTRGVYNLCLLCNLAVVAVAYWAWVLLYNIGIPMNAATARDHLLCLEYMLVGLVLGFRSSKSNDDVIDARWARASHRALRQTAAAIFALFFVITAFQVLAISRLFLFSLAPVLYLTLLPCNRYFPGIIARRIFRGDREERIVLVGSMNKATGLSGWLEQKRTIGFRTIGILSDDPLAAANRDFPYLGTTGDLENVVARSAATQVLLVELPQQAKVLQKYISICERGAVRLLAASDIEERFQHSVSLFDDAGRRFIALRDEPLQDPMNRALKRVLDLCISLPVTLLVLPVATILVWTLQRMQSPGPVFFIQTRVGMQNRAFKIIKFRTMHTDRGDEARQATRTDERAYPAGRWLRRFSIDELPQFFNVLLGTMSVVGPRPHLNRHNEIFARALNNFHVRGNVKPGITGLAQVRGHRGEIREERDIIQRVNADIHYLEHWSLALDCYLILQTAKQAVFPPERAY